MRKFYTPVLTCVSLLFLFIAFSTSKAYSQTTITTLPNPPYTGGTSLTAPGQISFVIDNTNPFAVNVTSMSNWMNTTENNSIWQLYYSATSLSGAVTDITTTFTLHTTSGPTPVT